jgi:glycosyltransferase involved in cell wall biosynthesis
MRLAWFSPLPPNRSGIAAYSVSALTRLARRHEIHAFVDDRGGPAAVAATTPIDGVEVFGAHDFVWRDARAPYDLAVYQLGNDVCHHYMWAYLVRHPGLVVMHDAQLHQARARGLIQDFRGDDYVAEFRYSYPATNPGVADVILAGLGRSLYYFWPMTRIPVEAARMTAVHSRLLADSLRLEYPGCPVIHVRQGVDDVTPLARTSSAEVRRRHGIPGGAVVFGSFGRVTPEKELVPVLLALSAVRSVLPRLHLLIVGDRAEYFDVAHKAAELGLEGMVTVTGYVADDVLPEYLATVDVCLNLRWPTARETSAAWLRCVAAGKPTVVTDLAHQGDIPALDLRSGTMLCTRHADEAVCVAVDLLDDAQMLRLALRKLGTDAALRDRIGAAARAYWMNEATIDVMVNDYESALSLAARAPAPPRPATWPRHLTEDGLGQVRTVGREMGVEMPL